MKTHRTLIQFELEHDPDLGELQQLADDSHDTLVEAVLNAIHDEVRGMLKRGDVTGSAHARQVRYWRIGR